MKWFINDCESMKTMYVNCSLRNEYESHLCSNENSISNSEIFHIKIFYVEIYCFHYCLSSLHCCEDHFHFFFSISFSHIWFHLFTIMYSSLIGFIKNQHNDQLPVGLLAHLVEYCTNIADVMGSKFFKALFSLLLNEIGVALQRLLSYLLLKRHNHMVFKFAVFDYCLCLC